MAIDTHAHYFPPRLIDKLESAGLNVGVSVVRTPPACGCALHFEHGLHLRPFPNLLFEETASRLSTMDRIGIQRQVLSTWADVFAYGLPKARSVMWHRTLNLAMASVAAEHPGRFSFLASLPLPHAAEAAEELRFAVKELGAVGAVVCAHVEDANLGEVPLDDVWSAAVELDVGVLIHPSSPNHPDGERTSRFGLAQSALYTYDTTLCVGSLIAMGVLDRYPKLRFLLCHGGGGYPYLAGRFDRMHEKTDRKAQGNVAAAKPSTYLKRFYYDSILHAAPQLEFLASIAGMDRIVVGSDYAFPPGDDDPLASIAKTKFTKQDVEMISDINPRRLFPALPKR